MTEQELIIIKHYLETLSLEVKRLDERESSEDSASIKQLVERISKIINKE